MFKPLNNQTNPTLFGGIGQQLSTTKNKMLDDKGAWFNLFRSFITFSIDESPFAVLFDEKNGRPNAPIRILAAMMILKEGFGWSDEELFEQCRFNVLVMRALGFSNFSDDAPVESTYYLFKKSLYEYQVINGVDLIGEMFEKLTKKQAELFKVNSRWIRMDSKLIGSNIANCSRLQLIISCLQQFYKSLNDNDIEKLKENDKQFFEDLTRQTAGQIVYKLNNKEKEKYLEQIGWLLYRIQKQFDYKNNNLYNMITRLFTEQYSKDADKITLKLPGDVKSDSIQSPHDSEAAYRNKGGKKVKGYSANITETCNDKELNLIVDVKLDKATKADKDFTKEAVKKVEHNIGRVEEISADGAYNSKDNRQYCDKNNKQLHLTGIQGSKGKYKFERKGKKVKITNTKTSKSQIVSPYKKGKYKFKEQDGKITYFTDKQIDSYFQRKKIDELPPPIRNRRNNIEATIFQLCYFTRKDKTRYRGHYKTQVWATCRSIWINLVRIENYIGKLYPDGIGIAGISQKAVGYFLFLLKKMLMLRNYIENLLEIPGFKNEYQINHIFYANSIIYKQFNK